MAEPINPIAKHFDFKVERSIYMKVCEEKKGGNVVDDHRDISERYDQVNYADSSLIPIELVSIEENFVPRGETA